MIFTNITFLIKEKFKNTCCKQYVDRLRLRGTMTKWPVQKQTLRIIRNTQNNKTRQTFRINCCLFACLCLLFYWEEGCCNLKNKRFRRFKLIIGCTFNPVSVLLFVFSSHEHEVLMVSYCGQWLSVVRRASSVVRRASCAARQHLMFTL